MHMLALRLAGGQHHDAEEVVQEAWFRACRALPAFRGESSLSTWLCGFVVNCHREQRRHPMTALDDVPEPSFTPALDAALEQLVSYLPDRCREVLVLHDIHGYKHEEIATMLQIAEGTSKHHLFRARQILSKWLQLTPGSRRTNNDK